MSSKPAGIPAARFAALWSARGPGPDQNMPITDRENAIVGAFWKTMSGSSCWMDAFHALWRQTDPAGHREAFGGRFYETEQSMADEDCQDSDDV